MKKSIFIIFLFWYTNLQAQEYGVTLFTTHQGLPTDLAKSIEQDNNGFIWIGTDAGLVRYDGLNFKVFESEPGTDYVKSFAKSREGHLFVIHDKGIHEIISEPDTTIFKELVHADASPTDSTIAYPKAMFIDSKGQFWISERDVVTRFENKKLHRYTFDEKNLSSSYVKSFFVFEDLRGTLWAVSYNGYLYYFDPLLNEFKELKLPLILGNVNSVLTIDKGKIWLTATTGVYELLTEPNQKLKSITRISKRGDMISMIKMVNNEIFMGSMGMGLFKVIESQPSLVFEKIEQASQRSINYLFQQSGNLWISSDEGIGLVQRLYFGSLHLNDPTQFIQAIALTGNDVVYFSTGNKIYKARKIREGEYDVKAIRTVESGYIAYLIPYGNGVCFSDSNSSLHFIDSEGKTINRIDPGNETDAYYYTIFYLTSDRNKNVWACRDHSMGITKVSRDFRVTKYGLEHGLSTKLIVARESKKGTMYFGGQGDSSYLYKYDAATDRFINLSVPLHSKAPVSVNDIFIDDDEAVWLATDAGLFRYQNGSVSKVELDKKYNDQALKAICITDKINLWLGTNTGLVKFRNGELVSLDESSGLPAKTVNYRCLYEDVSGKLWVGTAEGIAFTQGKDLFFELTPKPIFISLKINGKETKVIKDQWFPSNSYMQASYLSLSFPGNQILYQTRFSKSGPWSESSEKSEITIPKLKSGLNVFQVRARRMGGYDWSEVATLQFFVRTSWYYRWWAFVLYIGGGFLFFWVIAEFNSKRLIADKRKLEKTIKEATQEIIEKNNIINEQNEQLRNINLDLENKVNAQTKEVRQAYARLLNAHKELDTFVYKSSHDLRGPVARLLGLCHLALVEIKDPTSLEYISRLEQTSKEMDILLDRLMRTQEVKNTEISKKPIELKKMVERIVTQLLADNDKKKIHVEIEIPDSLILNTDSFLLGILFENIVKNAIQFVDPAKSNSVIRVRATKENSDLFISIADNGLGIVAEAKKNLFEIFFRATSEVGGTGLGLYEAKIICERLEGHIQLNENNTNETEFIIYLPAVLVC